MLWTHVIISGELDLPYIDLHYADNTEVLPWIIDVLWPPSVILTFDIGSCIWQTDGGEHLCHGKLKNPQCIYRGYWMSVSSILKLLHELNKIISCDPLANIIFIFQRVQ
jgi:hypothetical protein